MIFTHIFLFAALGAACKNLVLSYKRIQALAGLTSRVSELLDMLNSRAAREDEKVNSLNDESHLIILNKFSIQKIIQIFYLITKICRKCCKLLGTILAALEDLPK